MEVSTVRNKLSLLLFIFLSSAAVAATSDFKLSLSYSTYISGTQNITIQRKAKVMTYNNYLMPAERIHLGKDIIGYLLLGDIVKDESDKCRHGKYSFTITSTQKNQIEKGCMNTKRFTQLLWAFETI